MTKRRRKRMSSPSIALKFAIKIDLSVSYSTLMIEFWTTIVLSVIRFSIAHHTWPQCRMPYERDSRHIYWSTIIVYLSYITSNLFILECGWSVFHINQQFSCHFFPSPLSLSLSLLCRPTVDTERVLFILFFCLFLPNNVIVTRLFCLRTVFVSESAFSTFRYIHSVLWYHRRYKILVFCGRFFRWCASRQRQAGCLLFLFPS